jgi:hypothetical protein
MFRQSDKHPIVRLLLTLLIAGLSGCSSYGPKSMDKDQLDYGRSIGDNWKNQMLVNIIKLRFVDMPVFVDVGQIVAGYSLETSVDGKIGFGNSLTGGDAQELGAGGKFTDRPTITYTPKTGNDYLRSMLTPIEPASLLSLILAGYNAELLFTWAVESVNGVNNYSAVKDKVAVEDPEFREFVLALREMQKAGVISFQMETDPETAEEIVLVMHKDGLDEDMLQKSRRSREILKLDPERDHFKVMYSPFANAGDTLAMQTRSMMQILESMSGFVQVPPDKSTHAAPGFDIPPGAYAPFRVHSSPDRPDSAFAEVRYEGDWYWIEHSDLDSKRVFTLMLFLTTLTNTGDEKAQPVLTIPTS